METCGSVLIAVTFSLSGGRGEKGSGGGGRKAGGSCWNAVSLSA